MNIKVVPQYDNTNRKWMYAVYWKNSFVKSFNNKDTAVSYARGYSKVK